MFKKRQLVQKSIRKACILTGIVSVTFNHKNMTLEEIISEPVNLAVKKTQLIEYLEKQTEILSKVLSNFEITKDDFDIEKADRIYLATKETIELLKDNALQKCTDKQILFHCDLMLFRAKAVEQKETEAFYCALRKELESIFSLNK